MQNIVIQSNEYYESTKLIIEEWKKMWLNMFYAKNSDFEIKANWSNLEIYFQWKEFTKKNFDAVYFRTTLKYRDSYMLIAKYAKDNWIYVLDYNWLIQYGEKLYNLDFMRKSELKIIPTYSSMDWKIPGKLDFDFPVIYKPAIWKQWIWVEKIETFEELKNKLKNKKESYLIQKFIKNSWDIRVIIIWKKIIWAMKRISAWKDFRNNISLWGTWKKYEIWDDLRKKIKSFIEKSQVQYDFYWLDLIEDEEKKWEYYFMEYDRSIQFNWFSSTTWINVARELLEYIIKKI